MDTTYTCAQLEMTPMTPEQFMASDREDMKNRFLRVIAAESPVVDDWLQLEVLHSYGMKKRGRRLKPILDDVMASLPSVVTVQKSADGKEHSVYWSDAWRGKDIEREYTSYRLPGGRDVTDIPVIEIANAMAGVAVRKKAETFKATAQIFGWKKQGTNIKKTFSRAWSFLKSRSQA